MRQSIFILFPLLFLVSVIYALPSAIQFAAQYPTVFALLPYLSLIAGMGLAWRFNRGRIFVSLLLFLLFYLMIQLAEGMGENGIRLLLMCSLLLPLNLLFFSFFKERGIFNGRGMVRFYLILFEAAVVWWFMADKSGWEWWLLKAWLPISLEGWGVLQSQLIIVLLVVAWQLVRLIRQPTQVESSLLLAMLLVMLPLLPVIPDQSSASLFTLAGIILIISLVQESYSMAFRDELTGLPGRRAMMDTLMGLGSNYSIAMLDVDHFKKFNDSYGHDAGDQVLCMVAEKVGRVKGGGKAARYGGEEFAIIFPNKAVEEVLDHLEDVRRSIEKTPFAIRGKDRPREKPEKVVKKPGTKRVQVTISIGVAAREQEATPEEVMKRADQALYRAKKKGRNRVCQ